MRLGLILLIGMFVLISPIAIQPILAVPPASQALSFSLVDLNGKPVALSQFSNKVIVLAFWATWCPPCVTEVPRLNRLQADYASRGLQVIGISLDDSSDTVKQFQSRHLMRYQVLMGTSSAQAAVGGIRAIPTLVILDRQHHLQHKLQGLQSEERLHALLEPLVRAKTKG